MGYPLQLESGKTVELTDVPPGKGNFVTSWGVGITTVQGQRFAIGYVLYFAEMQPTFYAVGIDRIRGNEQGMYALTVNVHPWIDRLEPHVYTTTRPDTHGLIGLVHDGYVLMSVSDIEQEARLTIEKIANFQQHERIYGYLKGVAEVIEHLAHRDIAMPYLYHATDADLIELGKVIASITHVSGAAYFEGQRDGAWAALDAFNQRIKARPEGSLTISPDMLINALLAMIPQIRMAQTWQGQEGETHDES